MFASIRWGAPSLSVCLGCVITAAFLLMAQPVSAIPEKIAVSGVLVDENTEPLSGNFAMQVSFFDQPSTTSLIGSVTVNIEVEAGLFGVAVGVPSELTTLEQVWYRASVDLDGDGFDAADQFPDFHEIVSVPFALTGKPVEVFETSGGHRITFTGSQSGPFVPNTLVVVPFSTPPGGVRFNRLATRILHDGTSSYGIYDADGNLVVSSNGNLPNVMGDPFVFFLSANLEPSRIYYAAYTTNASTYPPLRVNSVPTLPNLGRIVDGGVNGLLPPTIDLNQLQPLNSNAQSLSFGLYYADEQSPGVLKNGRSSRTRFEDLPPEIQSMIKNAQR